VVGSKSRSARIRVQLRGISQESPQKGGLARSNPSKPPDADGGGSPLTRAIRSGRSRAARKRSQSSAETPREIGVRANRCADTLPNRQRGGACLILSGVARRRRREAEMPRASSASPQDVADTTKGVPSRSSIFSLWGVGSSVRGDGGTILTLAVKPDFMRGRCAWGGSWSSRKESTYRCPRATWGIKGSERFR